MERASVSLPAETLVEAKSPHPLWAAIGLVLSGALLMVVETPNLLFFLGLAFTMLGLYALVRDRGVRRAT